MGRFTNIFAVATGVVAALLGSAANAAEVHVRNDHGCMPDGTVILLPGESLEGRILVDSHEPFRLLSIQQDDVAGGPGLAWASIQVGARTETLPVAYWVHPWAVAPPAFAVADVSIGSINDDGSIGSINDDGSMDAILTVAHRTPRPLAELDVGALTVTFNDPLSGASAHFMAWSGSNEDDTLSSTEIVDCVALTTFTGQFPAGWSVESMTAPPAGTGPTLLLSGWGVDATTGASYQVLGCGSGVISPTAVGDVADVLAGWIAEGVAAPELACAWPPVGPPPPPPCQWQLVPVPGAAPPSPSLDAGQFGSVWWYGAWTHNAKASMAGSKGAKSQWMQALLAAWSGNWAPGLPCGGSWFGNIQLIRTGNCPTDCPCEAMVAIAARLKISGKLNATSAGNLDIWLHVKDALSGAVVTVFDSSTYRATGSGFTINGTAPPGIEVTLGINGDNTFNRNVPPTPPLTVLAPCGMTFNVDTGYSCSTNTALTGASDAPGVPYSAISLDWHAYYLVLLSATPATTACEPQPQLLPWSGE